MQQSLIFALHGFLGQAQDWRGVQAHTQNQFAWLTPDLFSKDSLDVTAFDDYAEQLIQEYESAVKPFQKKIFVGYSLGGRLGLHLLKKHADLFDQFIFVSVNPGLQIESEKLDRLNADQVWAEKIRTKPWVQFTNEWNSQPVFSKGDPDPVRLQENFEIEKLADSMDLWSLGRQSDMRLLIQKHQKKILWVVGDQDTKFLNLALDLEQKKILLGFSKIFSGHRILFSNPKELAKLILSASSDFARNN